jgi:hypothetical protein
MSRDLRQSEDRIDQLVAALGHTRPVLDDIARARVAALVEAQRRAAEPVPPPLRRRRWVLGAAVAAALAIVLVLRVTEQPPVAPIEPVVIGGELPEGAILSAPAGAAVRAQIAGAQVTVRGPGWATRRGSRIVAEAEALTVERSEGDDPVELEVGHATVRVLHGTVYFASKQVLRVAVARGEIVLRCPGDDADRPVIAGQSAICDPGDAAVRPLPVPPAPAGDAPPPPVPPPPAPARDAPPPPVPPTVAAAAPGTRHATGADERSPTPQAPAPGRAAPVPVAEAPPESGSREVANAIAPPALSAEPAPPLAPHPSPALERASPPVDTAARYAAIEQLMVRDPAAARAALRALVADAPTSPETASALLDLARLAAAAADDTVARTALDQLDRHPDAAALAMPARYLRCTMEQTDPGRRACLTGFRAAFPDSPRDAEVLARLAIVTARDGDCRAALPLLAEYRRRYPSGSSAADMRAWTAHCQAAAAP